MQNFEIVEHLFTLPSTGAFTREVNRVKWYDREPVIDIRGWDEKHEKTTKGVTLTDAEWTSLCEQIREGTKA